MLFVDEVTIDVLGGAGGNGCCSFRRERFVPRGGPDGGDGGHGGSVVVVVEAGIDSLMALAHRKLWKAPKGGNGQGALRHGKNGEDLIISVPPGTIIRDKEHQLLLKDLVVEGDRVVVARGGKGGRGNASFKSSTHQAPREFTRGGVGEERRISLELKVIADVGLIGKPNAGKSTLLSRLSRARPRIADYPFTTKFPNLGRVQIDAERSFVLADIPGLIEGAHAGVGLGHEFLRHIQRAGVLVHLVEPMPVDGSDPVANYLAVRDELVRFDAQLGERPEIVVISKSELPSSDSVRDKLSGVFAGRGHAVPLKLSAVTGEGLPELIRTIGQLLVQATPA